MKRSFIVCVCMSFCFVFPAEYDCIDHIQRLKKERLAQYQVFYNVNHRQSLYRDIRELWLDGDIEFDHISLLLSPITQERGLIHLKKIDEEWEIRETSLVDLKRHPGRRGDKHKKPETVQHPQHHRTNNRADRPTFAQCNNKRNKRKY